MVTEYNSCTLHVLCVYSARTASVLSMYFACTRWADLQYSIPHVLCSYSATYSTRTLGGVGTW